MSKGLIDQILDNIFDADWIGRRGEKLTERELKWVQLFGRKGKTIRNVYIPKENGETTEIDVLFITQKGIFVIESKNYSGWIFGDEKSAYWTVMLNSKTKNKLYNPIKQNKGHIKWLAKYIEDDVPLFSLIVFSERCELKKVSFSSKDVRVIKRDRLYANVREIWDCSEDVLSEAQIELLYTKLAALKNVDAAVKEAHVQKIKEKYQRERAVETKAPEESTIELVVESTGTLNEGISEENLKCPRCSGTLVLREAKKGKHAGKHFYGCSNYPKCRYVKEI